ncbi:MAG: hypothetical protein AB1766_09185 [Pseudomonadota bacterium]
MKVILNGVVAAASILHGVLWVAAVFSAVIFANLAWRLWKGPMVGSVIVQVGENELMFNDPMLSGGMRVPLSDLVEIRIVGPLSDRRIRVYSRTAKKEVYRGLRGAYLERIVNFLRNHLPNNIPLIEDEPPTLLGSIRGDF